MANWFSERAEDIGKASQWARETVIQAGQALQQAPQAAMDLFHQASSQAAEWLGEAGEWAGQAIAQPGQALAQIGQQGQQVLHTAGAYLNRKASELGADFYHTLRLVGQGNFAAALQTKTSRMIIGGTLIAASFMTGGAAGVIGGAIFGGVLDYGMQVVQNVFDPQVNGLDVFTHINAGQVMNSMFLGAVGGAVGELATLGGTALFGKGIQASFGKVFGLEMAGNVAGDMAMNVVAGQPAFQGFDNPWQWGMNLATSGFAAHVRVRGYQAEQVIAARLKTVSGVPVEGRNLDSLSLMKERMAGTRETGTPIRDRLAARNRSMNTTTIADASQGGHHVTLSAGDLKARGLTDAQVAEFQQFGHMMGGAGGEGSQLPPTQTDNGVHQARNRIAIILGGGINNVDRQTLSLLRQRPSLLKLSPELDQVTTPAKVAKHMAEITVQGVSTRWYDKVYVVDIEAWTLAIFKKG